MKTRLLGLILIILGVIFLLSMDLFIFLRLENSNKLNQIETSSLSDQILSIRIPHIISLADTSSPITSQKLTDGKSADIYNGPDKITVLGNGQDPTIIQLVKNQALVTFAQEDGKLFNGPFINYVLDFSTRKAVKLDTGGVFEANSKDGQKLIFMESECVKNSASLKQGADCNDKNLSLKLKNLHNGKDYVFDTWDNAKLTKFFDVAFSPDSKFVAFDAFTSIGTPDGEIPVWKLFIAKADTGEIVRNTDSAFIQPPEELYWLNSTDLLFY